jgi:aminoglycoside 6'-N-acetyltransferase I
MISGGKDMDIKPFTRDSEAYRKAFANLLIACFPHCYADCSVDKVEEYLSKDRIALMAIVDGRLAGFVGATPHYGVTGWELHPLAVFPEFQGLGIGSALVKALESDVLKRGGITLYLGTDDEFDKTSLSNTDLYEHLWEQIENIRNLKKHPYEFYQKQGFQIVGVLPDVNGLGKPDIYMAKRLIALKQN